MNVRDAAAYLTERGYRCSESTVRNLARAKLLECYRPGMTGRGRREFTPAWLDAFLARAASGVATKPPAKARPVAPRAAPPVAPAAPPLDRLARLKAERGA